MSHNPYPDSDSDSPIEIPDKALVALHIEHLMEQQLEDLQAAHEAEMERDIPFELYEDSFYD